MAWSHDVGLKERHDGDGLHEDLVLQQLGAEAGLSYSRSFSMRRMRSAAVGLDGGLGGLVARTGCTCADDLGK